MIPSARVRYILNLLVSSGQICSGQLIFEDNFNRLDRTVWEHENSLGGGGVSILSFPSRMENYHDVTFLRTTSFNGIRNQNEIPTLKTITYTSARR